MAQLVDKGPNLTATTISTIAVQTGRTRIVLAVLKHKNELHLRVQEMEPGVAEIGKTLEEAMELDKEHNECLAKLAAKQPNVEELLAQADELISTQQPQQEVYGAMADSLGQAWRDLNDLLEYRRLLLERAVAFHRQVSECIDKISITQKEMEKDMGTYIGSSKEWLQEHSTVRKDILESSMRLLGEAQSLVEFINDLRRIPAADSRGYDHATSAACYVVEELLETVHDRRRRLEELWQRRRQQIVSHQKLMSLQESMEKLRRMFQEGLTLDQRFTALGNDLDETRNLLHEHQKLETMAKEVYDFSLQLRRLHAQISPCPPDVNSQFLELVDQVEKWYLRVDRRRFSYSLTMEFYEKIVKVTTRITETHKTLDQMESQKEQIKPEELVEKQTTILDFVNMLAAPVFHEGQMLLERVEKMDASGVENALRDLQDQINKLSVKCAAFQISLAKRSESYRQFRDLYTSLYEWTVHVVQVLLQAHRILPASLNGAKDFLDLHEQLYDEMKGRDSEMESLLRLAAQTLKSPAGLEPAEVKEIGEKCEELSKRWIDLGNILKSRLNIVLPYADFHKVSSKVSTEIDVLRNLSHAVNADPASEMDVSNFETRLTLLHDLISGMQTKASEFFKTTTEAPVAQLEVSQAANSVNSILERLQQDLKNFAVVTQLSQNMRQKRTQWREFIEEVHQTITWIIHTEREAFQNLQLGYLGGSQDEAKQLRANVTAFEPVINEVRAKVDKLTQTAKATPVDADSAPERDLIVNDLVKAYERFVQRIEEYKVLLTMATDFYRRVAELETLMRDYESMINTPLPSGVDPTEKFINRHSEQREYISRIYEEVVHLGDSIISRIRQNYPQSVDLDTFHKTVKEKRALWDRIWNQQNQLLQGHLDVTKLRKETDELRQKIGELTDQMNRRKDEMAESLQGAKRLYEVQTVFEKTMETVLVKVKNYVSTINAFISSPENTTQFPDVRSGKDEVEKLWSTFYRDVGTLTKRTELAVNFYETLEEAEQWYKEATQALVTIGRKTTECRGPEDANNVLSQMENFLGPGEKRQEGRVKRLMELSLQVFGAKGPGRVEYLIKKNRDVMESFSVISNELFSIAENLHAKTVKLTRSKSGEELEAGEPPTKTQKTQEREIPVTIEQFVAAGPPVPQKAQLSPATFVEKLQPIITPAGQLAEFRCRLSGVPSPVVRWFRDGLPITNNPDYHISYSQETGEATLKIDETFTEDSGMFSCSAENSGGMAVSEASLGVMDEEMPTAEVTPPVFLKTPQDATAVEGAGLQFECQVAGSPTPVVTWSKNGVEIVPGKTKINIIPPDAEGLTKLVIPAAGVEDQGVYECKATNPRGMATCSITFTAPTKSGEQSPFFTKLLTNQIGETGELVKLECHVSGIPQPDIEWTQNGTVLHDSRNRVLKFDGKVATCVIFEYSPQSAGAYVCRARNKLGEAATTCIIDEQLPTATAVLSVPELKEDTASIQPQFRKILPEEMSAKRGEQLRLETIIVSKPEAEVQWFRNGAVVVPQGSVHIGREPAGSQPNNFRYSLVIDNFQPEHSGQYSCIARNPAGEVRNQSTVVELLPEPPRPPTIVVQEEAKRSHVSILPSFPQQLPESLEINEGEMLNLEALVVSHPAAEVQWLHGGILIGPSPDTIVGKENLNKNPETDRHFLVINSSKPSDAGEYVCVARNSEGEVKTVSNVQIKERQKGPEVAPQPSLLPFKPEFSQPLPNHVEISDSEPLRLEAVVEAHPDSTVQWLKNGNVVVTNVNILLGREPMATNPQVERCYLTITNPQPSDSGKYVCVAKNSEGETSTACNVKIHQKVPPPVAPKPVKPEFPKQLPPKMDVQPGQPLRLEAVVRSLPESQVQWKKNGNTVIANVDILLGQEPVKVSTLHHDQSQPKESRHFLVINNPKPEDAGEYVCVAKNEEGETVTRCVVAVNEAELATVGRAETHVRPAPPIAPKPAQAVPEPVSFMNEAAQRMQHFKSPGQAPPEPVKSFMDEAAQRMQHFKSPPPLPPPKPEAFVGHKTITKIEETNFIRHEGAPLHVEPPRFTELNVDHVVEEGHPLYLKCHVTGSQPLQIRWFKDEVEIPKHADYMTRYNPATGECVLEIPEVFAEDAGVFMIQASNEAGIGKCYCNLKVAELFGQPSSVPELRQPEKMFQSPPQFSRLFHDVTLEEGKQLKLECAVTGTQVHVQWSKDGVPLNPNEYPIRAEGANHSLSIPFAKLHDTGRYVCQADNAHGRVTCSAQITVKPQEKHHEPSQPRFPLVEKTFVRDVPEYPAVQPLGILDTVEERETVTETYARPVAPPGPPAPMPKPSTVPVAPKKWTAPSQTVTHTTARVEQNVNLARVAPEIRPVVHEKSKMFNVTNFAKEPVEAPRAPPITWSVYQQQEHVRTPGPVISATELMPSGPAPYVPSADLTPPTYLLKLLSKGVKPGEKAVFEARVIGNPTPTVTWMRENVPLKNSPDFQIAQHGDHHQLTIPQAFPAHAGHYKIRAINPAGESICIAELVILQPDQVFHEAAHVPSFTPSAPVYPTAVKGPHFTKTLFPQIVSERHRVLLECQVGDTAQPLTVKWFRNNVEIKPSTDYQQKLKNGICTLVIPEAYPEDSGEYTCQVSSPQGSRHTTGFLTVEPSLPAAGSKIAPALLPKQSHTQFQPPQAPPSYEDVRPKKPNIQSSNISYRNAVSDHSDIEMSDVGIYSPLANRQKPSHPAHFGSPSCGSDFVPVPYEKRLLAEVDYRSQQVKAQTADLQQPRPDMKGFPSDTNMEPPRFVQVIAPARASEGAEVQLFGRIAGNPRPNVHWMKNGQPLQSSGRHVYQQDGDFVGLTIRMALKEDSGNYTVVAENPIGQDICSTTVTVEGGQRPGLQRVSSQPDVRQQQPGGLRQRDSSVGPRQRVEEDGTSQGMAPRFVSAPPESYVKEGQMVRLDCRVSGRPYPEVSWFKNGVEIMDDWTHKLIVNETGAHSLMITHVLMDDAGQYHCVARNISGEAQFVVNVSVEESDKLTAPSFVQKLVNQQIKEGESVMMQARAVGMPAPTITWHKGAVEIFPGEEYRIDTRGGASTLYIENATLGDADWYQCHGRNSVGTSSTKAKLTVEALPRDLTMPGGFYVPRVPRREEVPAPEPEAYRLKPSRNLQQGPPGFMSGAPVNLGAEKPAFTSLLSDLELYEGDRARFETCLIPIGDQTLRVEWYHNGQLIQSDSRHIFGNNFGFVSLDILNLTASDAGVYTCRAINGAGEAQQTATLRCHPRQKPGYNQQFSSGAAPIYQPQQDMPPFRQKGPSIAPKPQFSKQLKNLDGVPEGAVAVFEAQIEPADDQLMKVEWYRNGQAIQMSERFDMKYMFGRAVLTIKQLRAEDSGMYMVKAHNGSGDVRSSATLRVVPEQFGSSAVVPGSYSSTTNVNRSYSSSNQIVPEFNGYAPNGDGGYNSTTTRTVTQGGQGYDGFDSATRTTTTKTTYNSSVAVQPAAPTFMKHLERDYNVLEGSRLHMEVRATGQGDDLLFTWLKNGQPIRSDDRVRTSFAEGYAAIDILTVYPEDAGVYTLRVANAAGEAFTSTTLHCIPAPQPYVPPRPVQPAYLPAPQPQVQRQVSQQQNFHQQQTKTQTQTQAYTQPAQPAPHFERQASRSKSSQQVEPTPPGQSPVFTQPLKNATAQQGAPIHLESRLIPVGDSTMSVLWYKDGQPLQASARMKLTNDWGHVALDILHSYPEDTGVYTCRAINASGEGAVTGKITVSGDKSVSYESSAAAKLDNIRQLEDWRDRDTRPKEAKPVMLPPKLIKPLRPEHTMPEGKSAHFECQIQPTDGIKVEWYQNGQPVKASSRIRTVCDFGFVALDIIGVRPDDAGEWACVIKNQAGQVESRTRLNILNEASMLLGTDNPDRLIQLQHLEMKPVYGPRETVSAVERPQFRTPLHNHTGLIEGSSVHLETRVTPINEPTQKIEWFHNGRPLLDGTRTKTVNDFGFVALDVSNLHPGDSGLYMVKATNAAGEAVQTCHVQVLGEGNILNQSINPQSLGQIQRLEDMDRSFHVQEQVTATQAPRFLSQIRSHDIPEDQAAHFECRLEPLNDSQLVTEWFKDGQPLKASSRYKTTHDFGYVALHIVGATSEDTGRYTLVARNALGRIDQSADLIVRGKKTLLLESQNPDGLQKIQQLEAWRSSTYIQPIAKDAPTYAPKFVRPLHSQRSDLAEGQQAHFEGRLENVDSTTKVEWYHNGRPVQQGSRFRFVNDFGYVALTISDLRADDSGEYVVRAFNDKGEDVSSAQINVQAKKGLLTETLHANALGKIQQLEAYDSTPIKGPDDRGPIQRPAFSVPLRNFEVNEGEKVHLESRLIPVGCKVEWFHNERPVDAGSRVGIVNDFGFVALDISGVRPEDSGTYTCRATNELGQAVATCSVLVRGTKSMYLETAHPDALPKLQALETFTQVRPEEPEARHGKPVFTIPLQGNVEVGEGEPVRLHCQLVPVGDPALKIEWFFNGTPLRTGSRFLHKNEFGHIGLDLSAATAEDSGLYTVRATNAAGEAVSSASVRCSGKAGLLTSTLHPESLPRIHQLEHHAPVRPQEEMELDHGPPRFVTMIKDAENVKEHSTAHFECRLEPSRDATMKVEWFHNGKLIPAANRNRLTQDFGFVALDISQVTDNDSGVYMVRASNKHGEAFSSARLDCQGTRGVQSTAQTSNMALQRIAQLEDANRSTFTSEPKFLQPDEGGQAPHFTTRPKDQVLNEGGAAHVHCNVTPTNDANLLIMWFKNGQQLHASSRIKTLNDFGFVVLEIAGVQSEDSGQYVCVARNRFGQDTSTFTIQCGGSRSLLLDTLHPESLPRIRQLEEHPALPEPEREQEFGPPHFVTNLTNVEGVRENSTAHLECRLEPSRDPAVKVEWFLNGRPLPAANRNRLIQDFGFVAIDINQVTEDDSGVYMVRASNKHGEAFTTGRLICQGSRGVVSAAQTSDMALQRIAQLEDANRSTFTSESKFSQPDESGGPPHFTSRPKDLVLNENEMAHVHCNVTPTTDPNLQILWFKNGQPLHASSRIKTLNDFGFIVLEISGAQPEDSGQYVCVARNRFGEDTVTFTIQCGGSRGLLLDTLHPESLPRIRQLEEFAPLAAPEMPEPDFGPPRFVTMLNSIESLPENATAHLECRLEPSRDPTVKVEWYVNGRPLPAANRNRLTQDFGFVALDISQTTEDDSGVYMVRASNKHGEAFTTGRINCQGTRGVQSAAQTSEMALQRIAQLEDANRSTFTSESRHLRPDDTGTAPHFTSTPKDQTLKEGDMAHVHCNVTPTNDENLQILWFKNGQPLVTGSRMRMMNDFGFVVLEISDVRTEDSGQYVCIARNKFGEDRTTFTLQCTGKRGLVLDSQHPESLEKIRRLEEPVGQEAPLPDKPKVQPKILNPLRPQTVDDNSPAHFETRITPTDDVDMVVEWFINGVPLRAGHRVKQIIDFGFISLDILYVRREDFGTVTCRVHNSLGVDETSTTLSQLGAGPTQAPQFTSSLQNVSAKEGESIHLQATLEPAKDPRLTVEWYWNGKPIIHGSRVKTIHDFGFVVLEISPIYGEDSGTYTCVARNEAGEAVSSASVNVESKRGLVLESQLPGSMRDNSLQQIQQIESANMHTYIPDTGPTGPTQPPRFISKAHDVETKEGGMAHFELRFEPTNDNTVVIEWFHNGRQLDAGSRFRRVDDFGFSILEINDIQARDAGVYTCVARNALGEARSEVNLKVQTFRNVALESLQPASLSKVQELEMHMQSAMIPAVVPDQPDIPPRFVSQLEHQVNLEEGDMAHFEARIEPTNALVEWFRNGRPIVTGSRIKSINDFGFVVLEISGVGAEDSGQYTCRAKTSVGVAETSTDLKVQSKKGLILESQVPGGANMARLRELEMPNVQPVEEKAPVKTAPRFISQLNHQVQGSEGESLHVDCRVEPTDVQIEWYFNGHPLRTGHRFKSINDFGYVSLDILSVYAEDSGEYVARAVNELGQDITRCQITVTSKESVITRTQLPAGMEKGVERLEEIERELSTKGPIPYEVADQSKQRSKPEFTVKPRALSLEEGEPAKFECKVAGYPRPRVSWMLNGQLIITGSRFKVSFDGYMNVFEIPRARQYDAGEIVVVAQNSEGTATTSTTLTITTKSDYRTVLKHSTSQRGKVPVPDAFQSRLDKAEENQKQGSHFQVDLQSVHRPGGVSQPLRQTSTDVTVDFKQQTTVNQQWQQQQQQPQQPPPPVAPKAQQSPQVAGPKPFGQFNQDVNVQSQQTPPAPAKPAQHEQFQNQFSSQSTFQQQNTMAQQVNVQQPPPQPPPKPAQAPSTQNQFTTQTSQNVTSQQSAFQQQQQFNIQQRPPQPQPPQQQFSSQSTTTLQQQSVNQQVNVQSMQKPPATPPPKPAPASAAPPWLRQGSVKREAEQPPWMAAKKTEQQTDVHSQQTVMQASQNLPPRPGQTSTSATQQQGQFSEYVQQENIDVNRKQMQQQHQRTPQRPIPTASEDREMSASEKEYTQRLQKGNLTEIRYVQQRETSESKRQSVQKMLAPGQGPPPADLQAPKFVGRLEPCRVSEGKSGHFTCRFTGKPVPRIEWYRENFQINNSPDFQITTTNDTSTLFMPEVYLEDSGNFTVKALNEGGMSQSTANLIVEEAYSGESSGPTPPSFSDTVHDTKAKAGETVKLEIRIHGSPPISISWHKNGQKMPPSPRIKHLRNDDVHQLLISDAVAEDSGWYDCIAVNEGGEARCSAQLTIEVRAGGGPVPVPPKPTSANPLAPQVAQRPEDVSVYEGESATFRATITGTPQPEVRWFKGNTLIKNSKYFRTFVSGMVCTLVITEAFHEDEGEYRCVARSPAGETTCSAFLKVLGDSSSSRTMTVVYQSEKSQMVTGTLTSIQEFS